MFPFVVAASFKMKTLVVDMGVITLQEALGCITSVSSSVLMVNVF